MEKDYSSFPLPYELEKIVEQREKDKKMTTEEVEKWADKLATSVCELSD